MKLLTYRLFLKYSSFSKHLVILIGAFFGSGAAGASNFAGATARAGANLVKQAPEPETGSNA